MIGDGLTKDLSSLHLIEDGTGRRAGPSPLRVNRHRETQSVSHHCSHRGNYLRRQSYTCKGRRWRAFRTFYQPIRARFYSPDCSRARDKSRLSSTYFRNVYRQIYFIPVSFQKDWALQTPNSFASLLHPHPHCAETLSFHSKVASGCSDNENNTANISITATCNDIRIPTTCSEHTYNAEKRKKNKEKKIMTRKTERERERVCVCSVASRDMIRARQYRSQTTAWLRPNK